MRQFLSRIQSEFGVGLEKGEAAGPRGRVQLPVASREDVITFASFGGIEMDDLLTPTVLQSLCAQLGIPGDFFGLEPEDPD